MTRVDPASLPFDQERMLEGLRAWVDCESPTFDAPAVNRMMDMASRELTVMGARVERIPGRMGFADCVLASFPHPRRTEPGVLILGHLDTVHPVGTLRDLPWRREGGLCFGPGIFDMKGGNYLSLEAVRQLQGNAWPTPLPVSVLFTSDEEVGSPSTRDLIEAEAGRHRYVLVPEPARRDGGVVTGRYAIARFNLETVGQPSHAGLRLSEGRSAIREMAHQIIAIEGMTSEASTFSVGVVHGGQWVNCVATRCVAEVLGMAKTQADLDRAAELLLALHPTGSGAGLRVTRGVTRPVWEPDEGCWRLYESASALARGLGFEIPHQSSGGGSDGNFTGALGIATLDGLGPRGDGPHTLQEHIVVESLVERGRLVAGLLATLI